MSNFDLRDFLSSNKLTSNSKTLSENTFEEELEVEGEEKVDEKTKEYDSILMKDPEVKAKVDGLASNPTSFKGVKADLIDIVNNSKVKSKEKMLSQLEKITNPTKLLFWYYNSVLAKAGMKVAESGERPEEVDGDISLEEPDEVIDSPVDDQQANEEEPKEEIDFTKYESVDELMKEIERSTNEAALKHKMEKVKSAYESLEEKASALEEGEHSEYISSAKLKEMKKNAKKLRKAHDKYVNEYEKKYTKDEKKSKKSKDTVKESTLLLRDLI